MMHSADTWWQGRWWDLPPLILHPFDRGLDAAASLDSIKLSLDLNGMGEPGLEREPLLRGRYTEFRMLSLEAILNFKGRPNFTGYSAGSHPSGKVRPEALKQLETAHISTSGLRSKAWDEFLCPALPSSTSSSPFVTTLRKRSARCGPDNR